jgi:hypothetical protein
MVHCYLILYSRPPLTEDQGDHMAPLTIGYLWKYAKSLWKYQNNVVHGNTVEEQANHLLDALHTQVKEHNSVITLTWFFLIIDTCSFLLAGPEFTMSF